MKKKLKISRVILVVSIVIIIIVATTLAILNFCTDTFKSNKEILVQNMVKFFGQEEMNSNQLISYFNKKQTVPTTNKGEVYIDNLTMPNQQFDIQTVPTITFEGKKDPSQKLAEQNMNIKYSDEVVFPINYRRDNDIYGLQTQYVSSKYVAIENKNLQDFARNILGEEAYDIPDQIDITNDNQSIQFTDEEKQQLKEKYMPILDSISDDKIEKNVNQTIKKYTLTLTQQEIIDIMIQFLNILKNDEIILNKVTNGMSTAQKKEQIEKLLENIQEIQTEEEVIKLSIEIEKNQPIRIEAQMDEATISIEKIEQNDKMIYTLNITAKEDENNSSVICTLSGEFQGLKEQEQVTEYYKLYIKAINDGEESTCQYNYKNTVTFMDNVQIEKLTQDNAMILNDYNAEQIANFIQMILVRIQQVNAEQMKELGIEEGAENPLMTYAAPFSFKYKMRQNNVIQ